MNIVELLKGNCFLKNEKENGSEMKCKLTESYNLDVLQEMKVKKRPRLVLKKPIDH